MKPIAIALCSLLLLLPQRQCVLASPDKLKEFTEDKLRGYFPNVKVLLVPTNQTLVALTCTQGIGPDLLPKFQQSIAQEPELKYIPLLQLGVQAAQGAHYRYFLLFFDSGSILFDGDAQQISVVKPNTPEQMQVYRHRCGFDSQ
jgi:hypothetical protein